MRQLERVLNWLGQTTDTTTGYYLYTFDYNSSSKWEGMFWPWQNDEMTDKYRHILDLSTGKLIK